MNKVDVSFLVITYNQEAFIAQTLQSILEQECCFDFEIIIADDFSSDATRSICLSFKEKYPDLIRLVFRESNGGVVKNWLSALRLARGKYISPIGGDDYYIDKCKTKKQYNILEGSKKCSAVFSNYKNLDQESGKVTNNYIEGELSGDCRDIFIDGLPTLIQTSLINASCFDDKYYDFMNDDMIKVDDFPNGMWVAFKGDIKFLNEYTVMYRVHDRSITQTFDKYKAWDFIKSHEYIRQKFIHLMSYEPKNMILIRGKICKYKIDYCFKYNMHNNEAYESIEYLRRMKLLSFNDRIRMFGVKHRSVIVFMKIVIYIRLKVFKIPVFE